MEPQSQCESELEVVRSSPEWVEQRPVSNDYLHWPNRINTRNKKNSVIVRKQHCGQGTFFQLGTKIFETIPTKPQKIDRMAVT